MLATCWAAAFKRMVSTARVILGTERLPTISRIAVTTSISVKLKPLANLTRPLPFKIKLQPETPEIQSVNDTFPSEAALAKGVSASSVRNRQQLPDC
jgi:hypothetical protein